MKEKTQLIQNYSYQLMDSDEFFLIFAEYRPKVFANTFTLRARDYAYSQAEIEKLDALPNLKPHLIANHFVIYKNDEVVGWSTGTQESNNAYAMIKTGVLAEHQNKGIYTALLPIIINTVREQGFQTITSAHNASNNQVIIPKLKAGFVISGLELHDGFGTLVKLSYFMNAKRMQVMHMRSGLKKPSREILAKLEYGLTFD